MLKLNLLRKAVKERVMVNFKDLAYQGFDGKHYYFAINKNEVVGELSIEFKFRVSNKTLGLEIDNKKGKWVHIDKVNYPLPLEVGA